MNLTTAFWAIGLLTIFGHLWKAVSNEPGTWGDFFKDKRNVTYLFINFSGALALLIGYAATTPIDNAGAIMFASTIGFGTGSLARAVSPSEATKDRKAEMRVDKEEREYDPAKP